MRSVSTFTRADGTTTYRVRFRLRGKQTSETFTGAAEAVRFATLLKHLGPQLALEQIYAEDQAAEIPTLDEMAETHIKGLTRATDGTRTKYRSIYRRVWSPELGVYRVDQINRHQIAEVLNAMVTDGKGDKTIANAHGLLAGIMKSAIIDRHITQSPCLGVKLPRHSDHDIVEKRFLTHAEYGVLRAHMSDHFKPLLDMLAGSGMRWGEAEALTVGAINFNAGTVAITQAAKWDSSKAVRVIGPTKTKRGRRTVTLPDELLPTLLRLCEGRARNDFVFTMPKGGQLRHATFHHRYWVPARKAANLVDPQPTIHSIRHSHAAWLIAAGVQLPVIQARLGHESITTTVDTYGHLLPETQAAARTAASLVFGGQRAIGS